MELTVCICTHNRPRYLRDCLHGLTRQTTSQDAFAVLVVDSGSTGDAPAELALLVAATPNASLIRVDQPGVSLARNAGAWACHTPYIAYIDDDAVPAEDWVARILAALGETTSPPAVLGGRVLPVWEAPLPHWWPSSLRGVLSIIETEGQGEYGRPGLPADLAPYTVNMVVNVRSLLALGGFGSGAGRYGAALLSDEDVQVAWRLRQAGQSVRFDSRIVVHHQIQAARLTPAWLLSRLYWQGASTVLTRRLLRHKAEVWRELPRRIAVAALCAPAGLLPRRSTRLIGARWRLAYALGFIRAAFGWHADATAKHAPPAPPANVTASV
ncbi:MAG: glycosyltransferase [Acetobacteraceae bacterium]